jgi:hypothetical protein
VLHLAISAATPRLRNLPAMNLASLCVALLLFYCCILVRLQLGALPCVTLDMVMWYSMLATFCWLVVIAFDVWNAIRRSTKKLQLSSGESRYKERFNAPVNTISTCFSHLTFIVIILKRLKIFWINTVVEMQSAFGEFKGL